MFEERGLSGIEATVAIVEGLIIAMLQDTSLLWGLDECVFKGTENIPVFARERGCIFRKLFVEAEERFVPIGRRDVGSAILAGRSAVCGKAGSSKDEGDANSEHFHSVTCKNGE